jgi:hypothetical protein
MAAMDPLLAPIKNAERREIGGVEVDVARCGAIRVKRMIYPPGFHWSTHLSGIIGSEYCMHSHVGFLAHGHVNVRFSDGCVEDFQAPQFIAMEPGHQGWVVGEEPAVVIEFDCEGETVSRVNLPAVHRAGGSCPRAKA